MVFPINNNATERIHVCRVAVASDDGACDHPHPPRSHTAMTSLLGLDLGKFKSVACLLDPDTQEGRDETIPTDPETLRRHLWRRSHPEISPWRHGGQNDHVRLIGYVR